MAATRTKRPSPILGAASAMIDQASERLVTNSSRFNHTFEVDVAAIQPNPSQPRKMFIDDDIQALASTMQERGQLQPILLRPNSSTRREWTIVAGERRWRAARLNGWKTILAIEHDGHPEVVSLLENLQRVDLTPVEEARGLQRLIEGKKWNQDEAAAALGKSKGEVSATLRILTLPENLLGAVLTSELPIPKNTLVELARVDDLWLRDNLVKLARRGELTVRKIRSARDSCCDPAGGQADKGRNKASERSFNASRVRRITREFQQARQFGHRLGANDRAGLEALRDEIDKILSDVEEPAG
jgi:ParB family chromosome partitioning protein